MNFVIVPLVVAAIFTFLPADQTVRLGVLLVLLCPCVDYGVVFSGLAGGSNRRLLAATPLLLVAPDAAARVLYLFVGSELADIVEVEPFLKAFLILIVIPLALAWALQAWAARRASGQKVSDAATTMMVPLMAATLLVVVASQVPKLGASLTAVIPFYAAFLMVMAFAGKAIARLFRLEAPARPRDRLHRRHPQLPRSPAARPRPARRPGRRRCRRVHPDPGRSHRHDRLRPPGPPVRPREDPCRRY